MVGILISTPLKSNACRCLTSKSLVSKTPKKQPSRLPNRARNRGGRPLHLGDPTNLILAPNLLHPNPPVAVPVKSLRRSSRGIQSLKAEIATELHWCLLSCYNGVKDL
ncbi:hypothetical protein V6N13_145303 [Hibiscus sabdariffa]